MDVIDRIKTMTKERDWTQYRLAMEANLPQTTIANIFHRGTIPSIPTLEMLCKAFEISLSDFFAEGTTEDVILSNQHKTLLAYWDALNSKQQQAVTKLLQCMAEPESTDHTDD